MQQAEKWYFNYVCISHHPYILAILLLLPSVMLSAFDQLCAFALYLVHSIASAHICNNSLCIVTHFSIIINTILNFVHTYLVSCRAQSRCASSYDIHTKYDDGVTRKLIDGAMIVLGELLHTLQIDWLGIPFCHTFEFCKISPVGLDIWINNQHKLVCG